PQSRFLGNLWLLSWPSRAAILSGSMRVTTRRQLSIRISGRALAALPRINQPVARIAAAPGGPYAAHGTTRISQPRPPDTRRPVRTTTATRRLPHQPSRTARHALPAAV